MNELSEWIELVENIFNRPFGILLIIAGLSFLLIVVLFKLSDIYNRVIDITAIVIGAVLIIIGTVLHINPLNPPENRIEMLQPSSDVQMTGESRILPDKSLPENHSETVIKPAKTVCLHYTFVPRSEFIWNTGKNKMGQKAVFYKPLAPAGYKILGHSVRNGNDDFPGRAVAVKVSPPFDDKGIMAYPARYERIWYNTEKRGSGAIWRPIPPIGYRCMGDVATSDMIKPDRKEIVCLKESLITEGRPGEQIWNDRGNSEISLCPVMAKDPREGFALNLFQGYGRKWSRRSGYASLPVLKNECIAPSESGTVN